MQLILQNIIFQEGDETSTAEPVGTVHQIKANCSIYDSLQAKNTVDKNSVNKHFSTESPLTEWILTSLCRLI